MAFCTKAKSKRNLSETEKRLHWFSCIQPIERGLTVPSPTMIIFGSETSKQCKSCFPFKLVLIKEYLTPIFIRPAKKG